MLEVLGKYDQYIGLDRSSWEAADLLLIRTCEEAMESLSNGNQRIDGDRDGMGSLASGSVVVGEALAAVQEAGLAAPQRLR